jgi:two-component system, OmpR family, sensor kinase
MSPKSVQGLVFTCDRQGLIAQVLRNDLNLAQLVSGQVWLRLVDGPSRAKAMNFLLEIGAQGAALDWEMNIQTPDGLRGLHFAGGRLADDVLITAASNGPQASRLYEDMLRMNNEQTNQLRMALKEKAQTARAGSEHDRIYDEISRLNNELVAMQRELAQKNAELVRLNDLKNLFLGMAAHDLRSPLQTILTYSGFLSSDLAGQLDADQREFLASIQTQSRYMVTLVNELLDVAVIESDSLKLNLTPVDVVPLAHNHLKPARLIAAQKNITLQLETSPLPPNCWMPPNLNRCWITWSATPSNIPRLAARCASACGLRRMAACSCSFRIRARASRPRSWKCSLNPFITPGPKPPPAKRALAWGW